jgi:hypothetical protein
MTVDLTNIKIMSQGNFANVVTTSDDTLYFVEETIPVVSNTYNASSTAAMSGIAVASALSGISSYAMIVEDFTGGSGTYGGGEEDPPEDE